MSTKISSITLPAGRHAQISILTSVANGMPYLVQAVESILGQTCKNFEFIIVDDASTDKSWGYLTSLKDKRIKLIRNEKNLGLARSLNIALRQARGDFVVRMDADDISLPQRLQVQLDFLQKHRDVSLCGTWVKIINSQGEPIGAIHKPTTDHEIKKQLLRITPLIHPTWFGRREIFLQLDGWDEDFDTAEDYQFLLRAKNYKMANIGKELLLFRRWEKRRSLESIQKMYQKNLTAKWQYFVKSQFDISIFPSIARSLVTTYLFPKKLKILLNRIYEH